MNTATDTVNIETILTAPIEKVWKAWTDPNNILKWFGSDANGKGVSAKLDVRPQGSFEITFRDGDGTEHTCFGKYVEVNEPAKLAFTWKWKSEPGFESFVTVLLSSKGPTTLQHFEHAGLGNPSIHNYLPGWKTTFDKLERMLNSAK